MLIHPTKTGVFSLNLYLRVQNQLNKSENTLLNEPHNTARLASNAQTVIPPLDVTPLENKPDKEPSNLIEKEDDTKKTIFDFFKAIKSSDKLPEFSQDTQRTQKTETFDGKKNNFFLIYSFYYQLNKLKKKMIILNLRVK